MVAFTDTFVQDGIKYIVQSDRHVRITFSGEKRDSITAQFIFGKD